MEKAVIYVRVRVSEGSQKAIDKQMTVCKRFAEERGFEVVGSFIDNEEFGKPETRVSLSQLIDESRAATWNAVIIYGADRVSRNPRQFFSYIEQLEQNGKTLLTANSSMDAESIRVLYNDYKKSLKRNAS